jgi:two-component system LytT family sensor kinase
MRLHSETMELLQTALPNRLRRWLVLASFWTVAGVLSSLHWEAFYFGDNPYTWWELLRVKVVLWWALGLLMPLLFWFGYRFRIERQSAVRHMAVLVPVSLAFTFAYLLFYTLALQINASSVARLEISSYWGLLDWVIGVHSSWYFLAFWATIGIENAVGYYRSYHERKMLTTRLEAQLAVAQLGALRNQIQPHFLFNTLHSILALVRQKDNDTAVRMLTDLSDLLRYALAHVRHREVPLRQEIDFLRRYIAIEKVRFSDRLTVAWAVDEETLDAYVPSFVLQPLAENAIRHGIENHPGPGRIDVATHHANGQLCLEIRDNGAGLTADAAERQNGHGLGDMRERLDIMYPGRYSLDIRSTDGAGTKVELRIPWITQPQDIATEADSA